MVRRISPGMITMFAIAAIVAMAGPASAQTTFGVRAGGSADPDQFFVGAHLESPRLGEGGRAALKPNVEIGFGHDVTLLAMNLELVYYVPLPHSSWSTYFGGGPAANFIHTEDFNSHHVHGGFNILVGFQQADGLFVEMKVGENSSPGLKGTIGYTFNLHVR
jgi:hypothetical protein